MNTVLKRVSIIDDALRPYGYYTSMIMFEMENCVVRPIAGNTDAYGVLLYCVEGDNEAVEGKSIHSAPVNKK